MLLPFLVGMLSATCHGQHRPDFDAARLRTGTFHYRDHGGGAPEGESAIRIERLPDNAGYAFSNVVNGLMTQHWLARCAEDFVPLFAELTYGIGDSAPKSFSLSYQAGHVTGFLNQNPRTLDSPKHSVDTVVAPDTVDQRIDWAAVMSLRKDEPSERFFFHVYDPKAGNSQVEAIVESRETIRVDAGTFEVIKIAYRIAQPSGSEAFEVFASATSPRFLVKEVFPNGLVSELRSVAPL
jgi:hypothetical protein